MFWNSLWCRCRTVYPCIAIFVVSGIFAPPITIILFVATQMFSVQMWMPYFLWSFPPHWWYKELIFIKLWKRNKKWRILSFHTISSHCLFSNLLVRTFWTIVEWNISFISLEYCRFFSFDGEQNRHFCTIASNFCSSNECDNLILNPNTLIPLFINTKISVFLNN